MGKITQVARAIEEQDSAGFQKLCNYFLSRHFGGVLHSPGTKPEKEKTTTGKPDTYVALPNNKFVIFEVTTKSNTPRSKFREKLENDLSDCLNFSQLGVPKERIQEIVLVSNQIVDIEIYNYLVKIAESHQMPLKIFGIDMLADFFSSTGRIYAKENLSIPFETGQILTKEEFLSQFVKTNLSSPLDNVLVGRDSDLKTISESLSCHQITVLTGAQGVGKSRLALEALDNFVQENRKYFAYCIYGKHDSIAMDLFTFLQPGKSYLLLIDDANRQLDNLMSVIQKLTETDIEIKILITVREYQKEDVLRYIRLTDFFWINITGLDNNSLKRILFREPFCIRGEIEQERILNIAKNNPRMAIMAAEVSKQSGGDFSRMDVGSIYENYFFSFVHEKEIFSDPFTFKVLGLLPFFFTIDIYDLNDMALLTVFGVDKLEFKDRIRVLESLELVDVFQNSIVKVSDQVLATYAFWKAFIKHELLSLEALLDNYFRSHNMRIVDSLISAVVTFGENEVIHERAAIYWRFYKKNELNSEISFRFWEIFGKYFPNQLFSFVSGQIDHAPLNSANYDYDDNYRNNQHYDRILNWLDPFFEAENEHFMTALYLGLKYINKQKELLEALMPKIKQAIYPIDNDEIDGFRRIKVAYDFLRKEMATDDGAKYVFYYALGHALLNYSYKFSLYNVTEDSITFSTSFRELRNRFWNDLLSNFQNDRFIVYDLLTIYLKNGANYRKFELESDTELITSLIEKQLDIAEFHNCFFVHEYISLLKDKQVLISQRLKDQKKRFKNKAYKTYKLLSLPRNYVRKNAGFIDSDTEIKLQASYLERHLFINNLIAFKRLLAEVAVIDDFRYKDKLNIWWGFTLVIENSVRKDEELGFEILSYYVQQNAPQGIQQVRIFNAIFQLYPDSKERLYQLIIQSHFENKQYWLYRFFDFLPDELVKMSDAERVLQAYQSPANNTHLFLSYFEKYNAVKPGLIVEILQLFVAKRKVDKDFRYRIFNDFFLKAPELASSNFQLYKQIYIQQLEMDPAFDINADAFYQLLEIDPSFYYEYMELLIEKNKKYSGAPNIFLNDIWKFPGAPDMVYDTLLKVNLANLFSYSLEHFGTIFYVNLKQEYNKIAYSVIEKLIVENNGNHNLINIALDTLRNSMKQYYMLGIQKWMQINGDIEIFKKLKWHNNSFSSTGNQIWADFKVVELNQILEAIESLPENYKYFEHKEELLRRIASETKQGDYERKLIYSGYR